MRKIDLEPPDTKAWKRWLADCVKARDEVVKQVERGETPTITNIYKRKSIEDTYFFSKGPPFYGKCAYCEAPIPDYQHGDIEHFRPKGGVTDEDDQSIPLRDAVGKIQKDSKGNSLPHPGYYWLAYDWRNLLPSCTTCNQPKVITGKKVGKRTRFPVEGRHAQRPEEVASEEPLLINPASGLPEDDPENHLLVDPKTGLMGHRTVRGDACIKIFGLNVRDQLIIDRKRALEEARSLMAKLCEVGGNAEAARDLDEIKNGKRTFTMAQLAMIKELTKHLLPHILDDSSL